MTYKILFIDDSAASIKLFMLGLQRINLVNDVHVEIHWGLDLYMAKQMIANRLHEFDLIICDIMGTINKYDNIDIKEELEHHNVIVTSAILMPQEEGIVFYTKDELPKIVSGRITLHRQEQLMSRA